MAWDLSTIVIFRGIWREHNNRIFNDLTRSPDQTFHACSTFIYYWFCLLSGGARERAQKTLSQTHGGEVFDNYSKESRSGGSDEEEDTM